MKKQSIGLLRITLYLVLIYFFDISFIEPGNMKFWVSDMIHGSHADEFRVTISVTLVMIILLSLISFYAIQTVLYILIGNALDEKNTSLFRFLRIVIRDLRECANDSNFWTSNSGSGDLNNIERVLSYRDNMMALMDNKAATEYMSGTGHVDFMMSRPDLKQSRKALSYMNNKMALMDNETALNYIKGNKYRLF